MRMQVECLNLLLGKEGIDVNKMDKRGFTALFVACQEGRAACVQALVQAIGVNINNDMRIGATALHMASHEGKPECNHAPMHRSVAP